MPALSTRTHSQTVAPSVQREPEATRHVYIHESALGVLGAPAPRMQALTLSQIARPYVDNWLRTPAERVVPAALIQHDGAQDESGRVPNAEGTEQMMRRGALQSGAR